MTNAFDDRLVKLTITIDGQDIVYDQNYAIKAAGTKFTNGNLGTLNVRVDNISKVTRDLILTKTSPWTIPRTISLIKLEVGRLSYGTFLLFEGNGVTGTPTQPPDIGLVLTSLSGSFLLGTMAKVQMPAVAQLSKVAQQVADAIALPLDFQATDRQISNFTYTGPSTKLVSKLNQVGGILAFVDTNRKLLVLDSNTARDGDPIAVNSSTGMVGVPDITELGVTVRMLILNELSVGQAINVQSVINPAANGTFFVYKLGFEIASRDTPFYWIIEARRHIVGVG